MGTTVIYSPMSPEFPPYLCISDIQTNKMSYNLDKVIKIFTRIFIFLSLITSKIMYIPQKHYSEGHLKLHIKEILKIMRERERKIVDYPLANLVIKDKPYFKVKHKQHIIKLDG